MSINYLIYFLLAWFVGSALVVCYNVLIPKMTNLLIVRDPLNKQSYVREYNCIETTKKDGSKWWRSFPSNTIMTPAPPREVIDVMKSGRKCAEGYMLSRDQFKWIKDRGLQKDDKGLVVESLETITTSDRMALVHEITKATKERGTKWLSPEFIMPMTALLILGGSVLLGLIFLPDVFKSFKTFQDSNLAQSNVNLQVAQTQAKITEALGVRTGVIIKDAPQIATSTIPITSNPTNNPPNTT